jgi:hypothetical protein
MTAFPQCNQLQGDWAAGAKNARILRPPRNSAEIVRSGCWIFRLLSTRQI